MFTNRRPPPKSPGGAATTSRLGPPPPDPASNLNPATATAPTSTTPTVATMTLSDRIKTQVRQRTVIQTKVQTVVRTITRPTVRPPPPPRAVDKGKAKAGNGNASKRPPANMKQLSTRQAREASSASSSSSTATTSEPDTRRRPRQRTKQAKRTRSSSVSSVEAARTRQRRDDGYESSSSLSSADEDYFSGRLGGAEPVEGAPACVRNVASDNAPLVDEDGREIEIVSSESVVLRNLDAYVTDFFADPANPQATARDWCGEDIPTFALEYPAVGGKERFALVAPKRNDEYNPIEDLMVTIETILEHFLTPAQSLSLFGYTPGSSFSSFSSFLKPLQRDPSSQHLPPGLRRTNSSSSNPRSAAASRSSSPAINHLGTPKLSTPEPTPLATAPNLSATTTTTAEEGNAVPTTGGAAAPAMIVVEPLLRSLEKARNRRDGPTFFRHLEHFNSTLAGLKRTIAVETIPAMAGLREKVWTKVFHQCYDRTVGPDIEELRKYAAFSDNVYGELLPKFMNEIFHKTDKVLGPGKTFVDLGSGVGNCVVQAALATGADSYGFENMAHASHLARLQLREARARFKTLWGLGSGTMECHEADFCESSLVPKVLKKADLVLVNNEVFTAALNDRLAYLFLDLPEDCFVVSLKPFLPPSFKLSSHNSNHPLAYLSQRREQYRAGSVSWKMDGGSYFIARVQRKKLERWVQRQLDDDEKRRKDREDKRGHARSRRSESASVLSASTTTNGHGHTR